MIRPPYCTHWYPKEEKELKTYLDPKQEKVSSRLPTLLVPHAGWIYSGRVAGKCYSSLSQIDCAILLGTNHTGLGAPTSLYPSGDWKTPFGTVGIDSQFTDSLLKVSQEVESDIEAHTYEHAIEVQIPFLQMLNPSIQIVPIEMRDYRKEVCQEIAQSLTEVITTSIKKNPKRRFCLIASSDMTHCGEQYGQNPPIGMSASQFAHSQDSFAIDAMLQLNASGLLEIVKEKEITMCGYGPAAVVLETAKKLGAQNATLLEYTTSSDVTGEKSLAAVGYAGILIH